MCGITFQPKKLDAQRYEKKKEKIISVELPRRPHSVFYSSFERCAVGQREDCAIVFGANGTKRCYYLYLGMGACFGLCDEELAWLTQGLAVASCQCTLS